MAIYLVRHGETEWTLGGRHTGTTDLPLTPAGEAQAVGLKADLAARSFARVIVSPRRRAIRTAELAGFSGRLEVDPRLAEYDYGQYEGLTAAEIEARQPGWELWRDGCPGGEMPGQVLARARELLAGLPLSAEDNSVIFGHGHILRAVAAAYLGLPVSFCTSLILKVASVSILATEHNQPAIDSWDLTHPAAG
ncbi:MAG: histidine phosphatase family protein [Candidatus Dormibacteraeota bacterium]|nr:histidine phosphatase family protein [Candidatus Dormibacteraeota bacterium]